MGKGSANYKHFIPEHKLNPTLQASLVHNLVDTEDKWLAFLDKCKSKGDKLVIAYDSETNSLDPTTPESELVGFSVAIDNQQGYYIPLKHKIGTNIPNPSKVLDQLVDLLKSAKLVAFYNYRFDARWLQYQGYDVQDIKYYDVAIGIWFADSNVSMPSLKWAERHFLGLTPDNFEETLGGAENFAMTDPKQSYQYASMDALGTMLLLPVSLGFFKASQISGKLDNKVLYPLMQFENDGIIIDREWIHKLIDKARPRMEFLRKRIFSAIGYEFSLQSPKQLGDALMSIGVNTKSFTATGQMKTDLTTLQNLESDLQVIKDLIEHSRLQKLIGSYLETLDKEAARMNGKCRFSYLSTRVPTSRLASGSDKKNSFFAHINVQSIGKPHPLDFYIHTQEEFDNLNDVRGNELYIPGYVGTPANEENPRKSGYIEEGFDQDGNLRSAFRPDKGCLWCSIDFSAQELRLPSILCGEPTWLVPFSKGEDVHKHTAEIIWGKENYDKSKRKMAKVFNFSLQYGGTPYTLQQKLHISDINECNKLFDLYMKATATLHSWQNFQVKKAKALGYVKTYFGFERRVKHYLDSPDPKIRSFGRRTVANTLIQTTGAYCTKLCICKLWNQLLDPKLRFDSLGNPIKEDYGKPPIPGVSEPSGCRFMSTIHDEVNLSIPYVDENTGEVTERSLQRFNNYLTIFHHCMKLQLKGWPIPLDVGVSLGTTQGTMFDIEMEFNSDGAFKRWIPKWDIVEAPKEEVKEVQQKKVDEIPEFLL